MKSQRLMTTTIFYEIPMNDTELYSVRPLVPLYSQWRCDCDDMASAEAKAREFVQGWIDAGCLDAAARIYREGSEVKRITAKDL